MPMPKTKRKNAGATQLSRGQETGASEDVKGKAGRGRGECVLHQKGGGRELGTDVGGLKVGEVEGAEDILLFLFLTAI